jgi:hypothetical protein
LEGVLWRVRTEERAREGRSSASRGVRGAVGERESVDVNGFVDKRSDELEEGEIDEGERGGDPSVRVGEDVEEKLRRETGHVRQSLNEPQLTCRACSLALLPLQALERIPTSSLPVSRRRERPFLDTSTQPS